MRTKIICEVHFKEYLYCDFKITASYKHAGDRRPCCISGGRFHQFCKCPGPLSDCKSKCDYSKYCKGYNAVLFTRPEDQCMLATSSSTCPSGCALYFLGNVGPLLVTERCGEEKDDMGGCHIKENQGMYIIVAYSICNTVSQPGSNEYKIKICFYSL